MRRLLLTLFQETPHQILQNSASKLANFIIVDIVKYLLMSSLATLFIFVFYRWLRRRKKRQESKYRLDKRIERARARHELTRLVMGTIFRKFCHKFEACSVIIFSFIIVKHFCSNLISNVK